MNPKTIAALGRNQWQILSEVRSGNNIPFDLEMYTLITAYQQVADELSSEERGDYVNAAQYARQMRDIFADFIQLQE